uniref:Transmembrane protein n=1 Tax=Heterorhabditis bacteriophora TaxID=37862 RepID=A0A1I7XRK2_HETBA
MPNEQTMISFTRYKVNDTKDDIRQEGQRLRTPATTPITPPRAFYKPTEIRDTEEMRRIVTVWLPTIFPFVCLPSSYIAARVLWNVTIDDRHNAYNQ